ncbi:MAG: IS607 family element RNA-guided endonuclease TnpB, partial [Trebonia sp.]
SRRPRRPGAVPQGRLRVHVRQKMSYAVGKVFPSVRRPSGRWLMAVVVTAYRFALDPTPAQERALRSHAGAARFAWNWGLARCAERYQAEGKWYSAAELHKLWNAAKKADPALAWWGENSKCAYQEAYRNLERALRDFAKSKRGQRKGRRLGFPRFKKKGRCRESFRFGSGVMRCSGNTVALPRLGTVRTHEDTGKLASKVADGSARVLSVTVSRTAQRWLASFTVEAGRDIPEAHARPGSAVGIDLGVKALLTGVDDAGRVIAVDGPRPLRASLRKLRRASRAHSRRQRESASRRKSAVRLARIHARVASVRSDALHKATTGLAARYETIVAEDLNVAGMTRNRRLARAIADQGFGQARRMLTYKASWNGGRVVLAGRWYPSSKTCSACGTVKAKLPLAERTFRCEACGHAEDRDANAARNLLNLAASGAESRNACGAAARPGPAGHAAVKQEPGTPHAGKTGTAAPQGTAAA